MDIQKNYPRYPVDLFKFQLFFLPGTVNNVPYPGIIIDVVRENPFGKAFLAGQR